MGKKQRQKYEIEVYESHHAFADCTGRFAVDQLLREYGFKIHSRRKGREPVWQWCGSLFIHSEAVKHVCFQRLEEAVEREYWYKVGLYT